MKKYLLFVIGGMLCLVSNGIAQSNVFNPNDSVVTYDPAHPPVTPPSNTLSKWVRTARMTWNTDKFKPYILNNMAFRLRYPNNYNPADTTKKYPLILFLHGGGEVEFPVDNELQLLQGAQLFQDKIDAGEFNGFMLFPQIQFYDTWAYPNYLKVNNILDSIQKYCQMDPDRVIVMGLSNGGYGAVSYSSDFPQRSAVVIASSPALIQLAQDRQNALVHIPLWLASGGEDANPDTATMRSYVEAFREKGGDVRYNMFAAVNHGTWGPQWALPYLVPYWTTSHKANPLIFHQINKFASASAINAKLGISAGFAQYQWQKDGVDISGATSNEYSPKQFGVYRVRFKRSTNSNWSDWSPVPASIIQDISAPNAPGNLKAVYNGRGFIHLDWDNSTDNEGVTGYEIFVNGVKKYTTGESAITADDLSFNTSYTFTVRAFDMAGNTSAMSSPLTASTSSTPAKGLAYRLYQGSWESLPNFNDLTPVKVGSTPNVDITVRPSDVNDFFGFVWEGYINIPVAGNYTFETNSDEGSKLYFNSFYSPTAKALINNDDIHYALTRAVTINIPTPGLYPIAMTFFERHSAELMEVYWTGPGITRSLIPDSAFIEIPSNNLAPSVPANLKALYTGKTFVNLDWDNSTGSIAAKTYDVYVNGVKKYTTAESAITADGLTPNTSYTFTVKAVDQASNASAASAPVTASTTVTTSGLQYRYYQGTWDLLPNFNTLTPIKTGSTPNVDITARTAGVNDFFGFIWEGYIYIKTAGTYTFETNSDDGSKLYFNSFYSPSATPLISNDGLHPAASVVGTVDITTPGLYPIAMTYFEKDGGESMQVYWSGPGFGRQLIPNIAFTDPASDNSAPSIPLNVKALYTGKTYVNLDWDNSTDDIAVTGYDVYVNGTKKYTTVESAITADGLNPNTSYTFTVKAVDISTNNSAESAPVTAVTTVTTSGLKYRYYEGDWDLLPNFNSLTPVKTGSTPNVDIVTPRTPGVSNYFGFVWEGYINIKTAGTYTFETNSDNGSKLYFNKFYSPSAVPLISNDGLHPAASVSATIDLTPGLYPITMTFFEKDGGENMDVFWSGPGFTRQAIPDVAFTDPSSDNAAPTVPLNVKALYTGKTYVNLDWDNSTDNLAVTGYDVYVNGTKKYTTAESAITADGLTPNTSYTFTVKAVDLASNNSAASAPVTASTTITTSGLKYRYYEGNWDVLPNFNALSPAKTGSTPNVDIVSPRSTGVINYFGFVWEGYINIKTAGTYTFETNSDNGSKLYFNKFYSPLATPLIDNDGAHPAASVTATIDLTPGLYPIAMTFFEKDGGENMDVYWSGPGFARQPIPDIAFTDPGSDNVAPTVPLNVKALYTGKTYVNLDWDNSTDNLAVTGYDVYVNGVKKYTTAESAITADGLNPTTSYVFTVKAIDLASNNSAESAPVTATTIATQSGLHYRYYEGDWDLLPNFNSLTPVKSGSTPNVDIITPRTAGVKDFFGFVWEGYINIKTAGTYTFETNSDNGSKLYFNSFYSPLAIPLVNNDGAHPATSVSATINIATPGLYPIAMTFFEKDGGENMDIYWSGPGFTRQPIPDVAFTDPSSDKIAPTAPLNLRSLYSGRSFVHLDWDNSTDNVGVTTYDIYVNNVKKYTTSESAVTADLLTAGTAYNFMVIARDAAGNSSDPSTTVSASTTAVANGLKYRYYEGTWDALPNFNALTPVKSGSSANVDIAVRTPGVNNSFGFVWEGHINIQTRGVYTFETVSDDGSRLYFNSLYSPSAIPLINNDGTHPATSVSATVDITATGLYPIALTFFEKDGGESMQVYISGPGIPRQLIPDMAFRENGVVPAGGPLTSGLTSGSSTTEANTAITTLKNIQAYPNPISDWINIRFFNESQKASIKANVFDINGRLVHNQYFEGLPEGNNTLKMNIRGSKFAPGTYFVRLDIDGVPSKTIELIKPVR